MASVIFENVMMEYFDVSDTETRSTLLSIDEADQNKVLDSLTSKLYQQIMDNVHEIDFSGVEDTQGDITSLENYEQMLECIDVIKKILVENRQDTKIPDEILTAISNIRERKDLFSKGFMMKMDLPILLYNTMVLSIVSAVSLIIATSIEYIKDTGTQEFHIKFDKVSYMKNKDGLLYTNITKFNKACSSGEIDKSLDYVMKSGQRQLLGIGGMGVVSVIAIAGIAMSIIPVLRELTFFFYHTKQSISDYFDIQADLLQMNTEYLRNNPEIASSDKKAVIKKQEGFAKFFRKIANAMAIDGKKSEQKAKKSSASSKKKYKLNDVARDEKLDSVEINTSSNDSSSSLF